MEKPLPAYVRLVLGVTLSLALAACGGPGGNSGGGSGGGSGSSSSDWATASYTSHFDETAAAAYRQTPEFRNTSAYCTFYGCASSGTPAPATQADAFGLINVHVAHTAGLTGQGQLVAIVDAGFRTTHQEFAGKTIYSFGTLPIDNHGTHVAGLVAARRDNVGMMGVAPDASLHLASFDPNQTNTLDFANVIGATNDAAGRGAVAQNNSWGFEISAQTIADYMSSHPGASSATAMAASIGYSQSQWASYITALKNFQNTGVIVFAQSNNTSFADGSALASLPAFDTDLQKAWIAVVNGYYEIDANNNITDAVRISGQCGYSAAFCLAADGTTTSAAAGSDTSYAAGTGTSYVAPQVSGAVALLAQAFPNLTPSEWVDRLLASANNTWFPAKGVAVAGTVDFGNGYSHKYSTEWGHGVVDLKAALSPIGSLALLSGPDIATAQRVDLASAGLATPQAYGDALARGLKNKNLAVFDALNGQFSVSAAKLVHPTLSPALKSLEPLGTHSAPTLGLMSFALNQEGTSDAPQDVRLGFTSDLAQSLGGNSAIGGSSALSLASDAVAVTASHQVGAWRFDMQSFTGADEATQEALSGVGVGLSYLTRSGHIRLGITQMAENGAVLGLSGQGAYSPSSHAALTALRLDTQHALGHNLEIFGGAELGLAQPLGSSGSLVTSASPLGFSGIRAGLNIKGERPEDGTLTLAIAQPLRIESGTVNLSVPTGRSKNGTLSYDELSVPLVPSGRELDLSAEYQVPFGQDGTFTLSALYALDAGHVSGAQRMAVGASVRNRF